MALTLDNTMLFVKDATDTYVQQLVHWKAPYTLPPDPEEETIEHLASLYIADVAELFGIENMLDDVDTPLALHRRYDILSRS